MEANYIQEIMAKIHCYIKDGNSERNKPNYNEVWEAIQEWHEGEVTQLEDMLREVYGFRVSSSFAENVNEWAIMQNKIKKILGAK